MFRSFLKVFGLAYRMAYIHCLCIQCLLVSSSSTHSVGRSIKETLGKVFSAAFLSPSFPPVEGMRWQTFLDWTIWWLSSIMWIGWIFLWGEHCFSENGQETLLPMIKKCSRKKRISCVWPHSYSFRKQKDTLLGAKEKHGHILIVYFSMLKRNRAVFCYDGSSCLPFTIDLMNKCYIFLLSCLRILCSYVR